MVNSKKIRTAISIGDPNGIGIEIILKALSTEGILEKTIPIVFGSYDLIYSQAKQLGQDTSMLYSISETNNIKETKINILNVFDNCEYQFGLLDKAVSDCGILSFQSAINAVKRFISLRARTNSVRTCFVANSNASSLLFECIIIILPTLSLLFLVELKIESPFFIIPE